MSPAHTMDPIPQLQHLQYSLRKQDVIGLMRVRQERFQSSFSPSCLYEWNDLHPEIGLAPTIAIFKKKLLPIIRPPVESIFGIHDPKGLSFLNQLRVCLSKLNFKKFKHNLRDTINPLWPTNDGNENAEHFLLLFPSIQIQRRNFNYSGTIKGTCSIESYTF